MVRYFEDIAVDETGVYGSYEVTLEELVSFAEQYDPQWFHTDPDRAAEESMYGSVIASGWHTASITMRLLVEGFLNEIATLGAKGVDELRWYKPVRPGDTLRVRNTILETYKETEHRGLIHAKTETLNQDDNVVFSMIGLVMVSRQTTD
ncbi:MaoC family dehydratase [Natronocalculus amylovorans]|uniref:MaoC family dehydratase n=1 Tax=Natronocalculus amylovorans TaxID=2917812 RepID=A0AAE3FVU8_9EURY|nr:MaoC family dehydratase [Natronocalculus amylovorans]MCL9816278.1 MaoC family dehydratase [Natronocalculus amylovorans]